MLPPEFSFATRQVLFTAAYTLFFPMVALCTMLRRHWGEN